MAERETNDSTAKLDAFELLWMAQCAQRFIQGPMGGPHMRVGIVRRRCDVPLVELHTGDR